MTVTSRDTSRVVTVEHALYVMVFAVGIAVRFSGLEAVPLSSLEAWNAWSAWQAASGRPGSTELTPTSPLWHSLQTFVFWLGADSDAWARSISAVAGSALVLAPWMLRGVMGRRAAFLLSVLLALDPWLIVFSRLADGAMLSTTLAVVLLSAAVLSLTKCAKRGMGILLAVVAGMFVVSGHMAWAFAPVLVAFSILNWRAIRQSAALGREAACWFTMSAIVAATAAAWGFPPMLDGANPVGGIGLVSASLTMWLDSALALGAPVLASTLMGEYPLGWPVTRLLVDQPLLAIFGIGGLVYLQVRPRATGQQQGDFARRIHWQLTLWFWLAWGGLLCLLPGRSPFSLLVLVLPLLIGAAYALGGLWEAAKTYAWSLETPTLFLTLAVLSISAAFWGVALASDAAFSSSAAQAIVVIVGLALAIVVLFGAWSSVPHALWVGVTALAVILVLANVSSAWQLNHRFRVDRRDGLFREVGAPGVRQLAEDIATLSAHRAGNPHEIPVFVQSARHVESPPATSPAFRTMGRIQHARSREDVLIGWYLRAMKRVTWGGLPLERDAFQIAPLWVQAHAGDQLGNTSAPTPAQGYIGSDYVVRVVWLPDALALRDSGLAPDAAGTEGESAGNRLRRLWPAAVQPRLRWAFYRRSTVPPQEEKVILWTKADGAGEMGVLPVNTN